MWSVKFKDPKMAEKTIGLGFIHATEANATIIPKPYIKNHGKPSGNKQQKVHNNMD
jgi:hypothetical protein